MQNSIENRSISGLYDLLEIALERLARIEAFQERLMRIEINMEKERISRVTSQSHIHRPNYAYENVSNPSFMNTNSSFSLSLFSRPDITIPVSQTLSPFVNSTTSTVRETPINDDPTSTVATTTTDPQLKDTNVPESKPLSPEQLAQVTCPIAGQNMDLEVPDLRLQSPLSDYAELPNEDTSPPKKKRKRTNTGRVHVTKNIRKKPQVIEYNEKENDAPDRFIRPIHFKRFYGVKAKAVKLLLVQSGSNSNEFGEHLYRDMVEACKRFIDESEAFRPNSTMDQTEKFILLENFLNNEFKQYNIHLDYCVGNWAIKPMVSQYLLKKKKEESLNHEDAAQKTVRRRNTNLPVVVPA